MNQLFNFGKVLDSTAAGQLNDALAASISDGSLASFDARDFLKSATNSNVRKQSFTGVIYGQYASTGYAHFIDSYLHSASLCISYVLASGQVTDEQATQAWKWLAAHAADSPAVFGVWQRPEIKSINSDGTATVSASQKMFWNEADYVVQHSMLLKLALCSPPESFCPTFEGLISIYGPPCDNMHYLSVVCQQRFNEFKSLHDAVYVADHSLNTPLRGIHSPFPVDSEKELIASALLLSFANSRFEQGVSIDEKHPLFTPFVGQLVDVALQNVAALPLAKLDAWEKDCRQVRYRGFNDLSHTVPAFRMGVRPDYPLPSVMMRNKVLIDRDASNKLIATITKPSVSLSYADHISRATQWQRVLLSIT